MGQDKYKFWLRGILFLILLGCLVQVISYIPVQRAHRKNGNYWPYFYQELPENSVDFLYLGNSHAKCTFIPDVVDDILGTRSIHVNTSGESIYQTVYEYQEILRRQDPRFVIIEPFTIYDGLEPGELKPWSLSFFYAMPPSLRKYALAFSFLQGHELMDFLLPYTSNHAIWKDPQEMLSRIEEESDYLRARLSPDWQMDFTEKGFTNYTKPLVPGEVNPEKFDLNQPCPAPDYPDRLGALENLLTIARNTDNELVFIEAPQFINETRKCVPQAQALIESNGFSYHALLDQQEYPLLWFGDKQHMSHFGAMVASIETAEYLSKNLDMPMDKGKLDYYKTYVFTDYSLELDGSHLTLTLVPADPKSPQKLYFIWTITKGDETLYETKQKGANILNYTFPEDEGEYYVSLQINYPTDNYYLRGGFAIKIPPADESATQ